ncbi:hypothetical protein ACFFV7_28190 [Nonomuraea spiralis]|uniref:Capsular polysaccharide biosynthesis protein n=1 Tax=Nonomuraea spiralis TaxID=46182 RepID=A0ABV5IKQ2_9ACTN|nr:hypothetical protein [Nonomuraea spiralis]GGT37370.1 hypothetical protein GCM10010176_096880 [Nonomuraea spiralis]
MEFWKAILGLLRRLLIGPPLLLLSILVGVVVYAVLPTHYTTDVSLVLATPVNGGTVNSDKTKQGLTNPFLSFNDALKTGASIVILAMNTQDVWTELGAPKDGPTEITIDDGRSNPNVLDINGPYIYIRVDSDSPQQATAVLMAGRERVASELFKWQKTLGAPANTFITSTDIVPPSKPEADHSVNWQGAIGGALLTLLLGLGIAYGVVVRRNAGRRGPSEPAAPPAPHPPVSAPVPEPVPAAQPVEAQAGEPAERPVVLDEDSSATMEFPAYRGGPLSPVPGPRKANRADGEK